eukprot:TRINITY_DN14401_c0_g1_i7.p1 TRINITY_DN14401_c0_g1~~TRINITY_DN14401_c0_g1_i7.p1  ORF type:complete len:132 (-),score=12.94 TRINITY_DN14401_c0_g1_i7:95-490(-)
MTTPVLNPPTDLSMMSSLSTLAVSENLRDKTQLLPVSLVNECSKLSSVCNPSTFACSSSLANWSACVVVASVYCVAGSVPSLSVTLTASTALSRCCHSLAFRCCYSLACHCCCCLALSWSPRIWLGGLRLY